MTDADDLPALDIGDHVEDRDADDPARMVVVGLPPATTDDYELDDGRTVADVNPDYPPADDVVQTIFPEETGVDVRHHKRYTYPRSRLRRVAAVHGEEIVDLREARGNVDDALDGGEGR
ncbi:MAG: hypothetical protein ACOCZD_00590 [Haloferacaceae archaeon]